MQSFFLTYRKSQVHYEVTGEGRQLIIAFHGYSDSCRSFRLLEKNLGNDFTIVGIDMPFHGKTEWNEGLNFEPEALLDIVNNILQKLEHGGGRIYLMGFSMGGRVALNLLQQMPEKIGKIILLAPDGFHLSKWYWIATQNKPGNVLFRFTMTNPGWLISMINLGRKMGRVDEGLYKFTMSYIHDSKLRNDLYERWTTMRKFNTNLELLAMLIHEYSIGARLVYGENDHVIRAASGENFRKRIPDECRLYILHCGHHILQEKNIEILSEIIRN